jgi:hypothetical protein
LGDSSSKWILGLLKDTFVRSSPDALCSGISIFALVTPDSVLNLTVMPSFIPIILMPPDHDVSIGDCENETREKKNKKSTICSF